MKNFDFTILVLCRGTHWVAQCIEYDIAAQGKTLEATLSEFQRSVMAQIAIDSDAGIDPLSEVPAAPAIFSEMAELGYTVDAPLPRFNHANRIEQHFRPRVRLCESDLCSVS